MLKHKHMLMVAEVLNPPLKHFNLDNELKSLVEMIDMKILHGPHSVYCDAQGNEGWSGSVIIETSHIAFHSWLDNCRIDLDIYSCKDFDPKTALSWLDQFAVERVEYKFLDREYGFETLVKEKVDNISKKNQTMLSTSYQMPFDWE